MLSGVRCAAIAATGFVVSCAPAVQTVSHIGRPPEDHVILGVVRGVSGGCGNQLFDFVRIHSDGTTEKGSDGLGYRIPVNKTFVVTDLDWQYAHPKQDDAAGKAQTLRLYVENLSDRSKTARVFESTIVLSTRGEGGRSERLASGFAVSSAARICPDVVPGPVGPPKGLQHLILRGYYLDSPSE